jgi:aspartate racemase
MLPLLNDLWKPPDMNKSNEPRSLGIIGGLGVGATVHYYLSIVENCRARKLVPRLFIAHADVTRVLAHVGNGELADLARYLADFADSLAGAGADVAAIASITPHICIAEIQQLSRVPLVSLLDETVRAIDARGLRRVALFGTRFTIEARLFGKLDHIDVVQPRPEEIDCIHSTYIEIVNAGRGTDEQAAVLRKIASVLRKRDGVEAIVLAGTELALVFNENNTDFPAVDCARVHIDGIMREIIG